MNIKEFFKIAFSSLLLNKLRTFLSVLGIVIGVASVIVMVSIGNGARDQITEHIGALGSNLITVNPGRTQGGSGRISQDVTDVFTLDMAEQMEKTIGGVKHVVPIVESGGLVVYGNENVRTRIIGVTPAYEEVVDHHPLAGRYIRNIDVAGSAKVAVLGSEVAVDLFGDENPIGRNIKVAIGGHRITLLVVGIMESKGQVLFSNFDNRVYVPVTTLLNRGLHTRYVNSYAIQVESRDMAKSVVEELEFFLARRLEDTDKFNVMSQETILETVSKATGTMTLLLGAIAGIALVVGGIGIMNIMLVSVTERRREIGIRKAIGAKRKHILMQFLIESITLSGIGGVFGVIFGWSAGYVASKLMNWAFSISVVAVVIAIGFATSVGVFFGIYPAMKAAKLDPVVALR